MNDLERLEAFQVFLDTLEDALRSRRLKNLPQTMWRRDETAYKAFVALLKKMEIES